MSNQDHLQAEFLQSPLRRAVFSPFQGTVAKINEDRYIVKNMNGEYTEHTFDEVANWDIGNSTKALPN